MSTLELPSASRRGASIHLLPRIEAAECLPWIIGWKLATFALIIAATLLLPFNHASKDANFVYPTDTHGLAERLTTWDAAHYLYLADHGYEVNQRSNAFLPLYPLSIRALSIITGDSLIAGLIISNVASGLTLYLLYRFTRDRWGREAALKTLILLLAFPTAFFLNLVYSEALFLLLAVGCFYAMHERHWAIAGICAALMPWTKFVGVLVIPPFVVAFILDGLKGDIASDPLLSRLRSAVLRSKSFWALAPIIGFATYLLFMRLTTGDAFAGFEAQKQYLAQNNIANLLRPMHFLHDLFRGNLALIGDRNGLLDRVFFLGFLASIPLLYRRTDLPQLVFYLLLGLVPLMGTFMSYTRYVLPAFAVYVAYGRFFEGKRPSVFLGIVVTMALMQTLLLALQTSSSWVA